MRVFLIALSVVFCVVCGYPQSNRFERLGSEDGLSQVTVTDIFQDEMGRMWFATHDGLNLYDGNRIRVFRSFYDNGSLSHISKIRRLTGDHAGKLYLLTDNALLVFDMRTEKFRAVEGTDIMSIGRGDGCIWIGKHNGLYRYDDPTGEILPYLELPGMAARVQCIYDSHDGLVWLGTSDGMYRVDSSRRWTKMLPGSSVRAICVDGDRNVWACTLNFLASIPDNGKGRPEIYLSDPDDPSTLINNYSRAICEDDLGNIWVGSQYGISVLNRSTGKFRRIVCESGNPKGLASHSVCSLFKDRQGTVWIGTYFGGVHYCMPDNDRYKLYYSRDGGLPTNVIGRLAEDKYGKVWICAAGGGVVAFDPRSGKFDSPGSPSHITKDHYKSILYDEANDCLWLGTNRNSFSRIDAVTGRVDRFVGGSSSDPVHYYGVDITDICLYKGRLYLGSSSGVRAVDPRTMEARRLDLGEQNVLVTSMIVDSRGRLWIGSQSGLYRYDLPTGEVAVYRHDKNDGSSLSSNGVSVVMEDSRGRLWAATSGYGLNLYAEESDSFIHFTKEGNGIVDNNIIAVNEYRSGRLILACYMGISVFDTASGVISNYYCRNTLPLVNINEKSVFTSSAGEIYLGSVAGMGIFSADGFSSGQHPFDVIFTELYIDNRPVGLDYDGARLGRTLPYTDKVEIKPGYSSFSVAFATDNYIKSSLDVVEYRLRDYEKDWHEMQFGNMLTYTNIDYGKYTLEIRPKGYPGNMKTLNIVLVPPFYMTWWAYCIYGLLLLSFVVFLFRQNQARFYLRTLLEFEKKEKEKNEELIQYKLRFFTNISHELRTPITLIAGQVETILHSYNVHPRVYNKLLNIHKNVSNMRSLISELLDFRKQEQGFVTLKISKVDFCSFVNEICLTFRDYALKRSVGLELSFPEQPVDLFIDTEQMHKVVNNLLSNAFKYTPGGGNISIAVEQSDDEVRFSVSDTGTGIPADDLEHIFERFYQADNGRGSSGTGIGLALSKSIVEAHGGAIRAENSESGGARIVIVFKKGDSHFGESSERVDDGSMRAVYNADNIEPDFIEEIQEGQPEDGNRPTVLVVEDNRELRDLLQEILSSLYNVAVAVDGAEGMEMARRILPDAIISDVMMPRMSGIELCSKLKSNPATSHIPIILLTAKTDAEHKFEGLRMGADDYITKPFDIRHLIIRCNNLINNGRMLKDRLANGIEASPQSLAVTERDRQLIERATEVVMKNIENRDFDVEAFACSMNMSRSVLFVRIKEAAGMTPAKFINEVKLKYAAELLLGSPHLNVSDIAYMLNFSTPRYFNTCFKERYGYSPTRFRENNAM